MQGEVMHSFSIETEQERAECRFIDRHRLLPIPWPLNQNRPEAGRNLILLRWNHSMNHSRKTHNLEKSIGALGAVEQSGSLKPKRP